MVAWICRYDVSRDVLVSITQANHFSLEINLIKLNQSLPKGNSLLLFSPFLNASGILRVGGHLRLAKVSHARMHQVILHGKHHITKVLIQSEHKCLLHASPTLVISSLSRQYYLHQTVKLVTHQYMVCRHLSARPVPPMLGQLLLEQLTPGAVFDKTGLDYTGHVHNIVKTYVCVFVPLSAFGIGL